MDAYGVWVLALSFSVSAGYLSISDLGLQAGVVRFVADADGRGERARIGEVVSSALAVLDGDSTASQFSILLGLAIGAEHLFHVPNSLHVVLRLLFVLLAGEALFSLPGLAFVGLLQGLQRYGWIQAVDMSRQVLYTAAAVILLATGQGVVAFGAVMVASSVFAAAGYAVVGRLLARNCVFRRDWCHRRAATPGPLQRLGVRHAHLRGDLGADGQGDPRIRRRAHRRSRVRHRGARAERQRPIPLVDDSGGDPGRGQLEGGRVNHAPPGAPGPWTRYTLALSLPVTIAAMILARPLIVGWVGPAYAYMSGPTQLFLAYQLV